MSKIEAELFDSSGKRVFPESSQFSLGLATSSIQYQAKLGTGNSDWDDFARRNPKVVEGVMHTPNWQDQSQFRQDIDLLAEVVKPDVLRVSLPWEKIEPQEGHFNEKELQIQADNLEYCNSRGIGTEVTLNHFAIPFWLAQKGGWTNPESVGEFNRFAKYVSPSLAQVNRIYTFNEPVHILSNGYELKIWPPEKDSFMDRVKVLINLTHAHHEARQTLKNWTPDLPVSMASAAIHFEAFDQNAPQDGFVANFAKDFYTYLFFHSSNLRNLLGGGVDFFGVNYYTGAYIQFDPFSSRLKLRSDVLGLPKQIPLAKAHLPQSNYKSDIGWPTKPEYFLTVLESLRGVGKPIVVSENGIADKNDRIRPYFLLSHLATVHEAMVRGIQLQGYNYWSFLDNPELLWDNSGESKFGLVEIDQSGRRVVRQSAHLFAEISQTRQIATQDQIERYVTDPGQRQELGHYLEFLESTRTATSQRFKR